MNSSEGCFYLSPLCGITSNWLLSQNGVDIPDLTVYSNSIYKGTWQHVARIPRWRALARCVLLYPYTQTQPMWTEAKSISKEEEMKLLPPIIDIWAEERKYELYTEAQRTRKLGMLNRKWLSTGQKVPPWSLQSGVQRNYFHLTFQPQEH